MKKIIALVLVCIIALFLFTGCDVDTNPTGVTNDINKTLNIGDKLANNQSTPTDINYSLERYNLIRRAYWVNGQRTKAMGLPCPITDMPVGYIILLSQTGVVISKFIVEGKVSSLLNYLTPISEYYERDMDVTGVVNNKWLADTDGTYGSNDSGIYFFTPDKRYVEWKGDYLYTDYPLIVADPVVKYEAISTKGE